MSAHKIDFLNVPLLGTTRHSFDESEIVFQCAHFTNRGSGQTNCSVRQQVIGQNPCGGGLAGGQMHLCNNCKPSLLLLRFFEGTLMPGSWDRLMLDVSLQRPNTWWDSQDAVKGCGDESESWSTKQNSHAVGD